jgi:hypothetical protein
VKGRSKIFNKLNKNRNCFDKDLYECMSSGIEIIGDLSIIGAGSFGILLRANTRQGYPIAIKMIIKFDTSKSGKEFYDMERELAFSYYMEDVGIGPEVLDSFYYNFDRDDFKKYPALDKVIKYTMDNIKHWSLDFLENLPKRPAEIQFIIMKSYEYDCKRIIKMGNPSYNSQVAKQMIDLTKKQIKLGIYCHDMKPGNFVGNISDDGKVTMKMIDFGTDYCTEKQIYADHKNDEICKELGVPYTDVLLISNVIQIYIMYEVTTSKLDKNVIKAFFDNPIFHKFFKSDWKSFIKNYINEASKHEWDDFNDPSTQLVHYCNIENHDGSSKYRYVTILLTVFLEDVEKIISHYQKSSGYLKVLKKKSRQL